jgi:hypothetical protein
VFKQGAFELEVSVNPEDSKVLVSDEHSDVSLRALG